MENKLHPHHLNDKGIMNLSKHQHQIRLNPTEEQLLSELLNTLTDEQRESLIGIDREGRTGYRNHSGRKPTPKSLILRRAIQIGLPQVLSDTHPK